MYENAGGQRLTLFFAVAPSGGDASYRYVRDGSTLALFWFIDGFACALTGEFEQADLMTFAREIYRSQGGGADIQGYSW
jgi:anti-sigma factor RsiW